MKTYPEWLEKYGYTVSRDLAADHRNMLRTVMPVEKGLKVIIQKYGLGSYEGGAKFTPAQVEILREAKQILDSVQVPMALLKIERDDDDE